MNRCGGGNVVVGTKCCWRRNIDAIARHLIARHCCVVVLDTSSG